MAEQSKIFTGPDTQEALLADRERAFKGFTTFTTVGTISMAVLLALMAIFLVG